MTESNPVQVTLSDDGLKIANIESTAKSANEDVKKLYDPNLMSVTEKHATMVGFAGMTSQYEGVLSTAKIYGVNTTALETAYKNLSDFMGGVIGDGTKTSDVDRKKLKELQDIYGTELAKAQNANVNAYDNAMAQIDVTAAAAKSSASDAKSEAQSAYDRANEAVASAGFAVDVASEAKVGAGSAATDALNALSAGKVTQQQASDAVTKAKSALDQSGTALSKANDAITDGKIVSQKVTDLQGGSKLTIAELENGLAQKVSQTSFDGMVVGSRNYVRNGDFSSETSCWDIPAILSTKEIVTANGKNYFHFGMNDTSQTFPGPRQTIASYFTEGTQLTLSFVYKTDRPDAYQAIYWHGLDTDGNIVFLDHSTLTGMTENGFTKIVVHYTIITDIDSLWFQVNGVQSSAFEAWISNVQIEVGTVATDYHPAPEDLATTDSVSKLNSVVETHSTEIKQTQDELSSKADQTTYDGLKKTVTSQGTLIDQTAKGIALKADASKVDTISGQVTSQAAAIKVNADKITAGVNETNTLKNTVTTQGTAITANKNAIALKANQTTVDTLSGKVTSQGSQITANKDAIALSATKSDLKTATNGMATETWTQGQIKTSADNINSTVSSLSAQVDYSAVGTNILRNAIRLDDWTSLRGGNPSAGFAIESANADGTINQFHIYNGVDGQNADAPEWNDITEGITSGQTYTVSAWVRTNGTVDNVPAKFFLYMESATDKSYQNVTISNKINHGWTRYSSTFKATVTNPKNLRFVFYYNAGAASSNGGSIYLKQPKLEPGTKATEFSNNPIDNATVKQFSSIEQTAKGIQATVADNNSKVQSQITQLANGITSTVGARDNLVIKSWFDDDDMGSWNAGGIGHDTNIRDNVNGHSNYLKLTNRDTSEYDATFDVSTGDVLYFSGWLGSWGTPYAVNFGIHLELADGSVTWLSAITIPEGGKYGMKYMTGSVTIPTGGIKAFPWLQINGNATASDLGYAGAAGLRISRNAGSSQISQLQDAINLRVTKGKMISQLNLEANRTLLSSTGDLILSGNNISFDTKNPVVIPNANIDGILEGHTISGSKIISSEFGTPNSKFHVDPQGNVTAASLYIKGAKNYVYNSGLLAGGAGWTFSKEGYVTTVTQHDGVFGLGFNSTANGWNLFGQSKHMKVDQNGNPYSLSAWFIDYGSESQVSYALELVFYDDKGARIDGFRSYAVAGGSTSGWQYLTIDNYQVPTNAVTVGVQYWAYNGKGHAVFSAPMLTQTSLSTGYFADTGGVVDAGDVVLSNNGKLTTTYDGINQDDEYYHSWNFARGTLSIGKGFITSNAHGVRTINGSNTEADVKGTLAAGYTKFTSSTGGRTYMDADLISLSTKSMTDMVVINSNGIHVNDQGITYVGGLNGSKSWGQFGGIRIGNGANTHTINSPSSDWIYFEQGIGDGNTLETIVAANLSSSSQLSKKKTVVSVKPSGSVVANTNLATYLYKGETNVHGLHMSPIIDDVNTQRKYYIAPEIMALDGETIDINKATFYGWSAIQALQRANERLQIRLRKLEIERSTING